MNTPWQCSRCGTHFPPGAVGPEPPAISPEKCPVCGGKLSQRHSAKDPAPDKRMDKWLWLSAAGEAWWGVLLILAVFGIGFFK